jgi:hypothetical protein
LADIAPIDVIPHRRGQRFRNTALELYREVRNATRGVEHSWGDDRPGGTRFDAQGARAALIEGGGIDVERQAANNFREKDPRAALGVDHAGVLADPTDARVLRVDTLLDRARIHIRASVEGFRRCVAHPVQQGIETRADDVVVIVAPGVPRDVRAIRIGTLRRIRTLRVVDGAGDDDGAGGWKNAADGGASIGRSLQVRHPAGVPAIEPLAKESQLRMVGGRSDAAEIEAQLLRPGLDAGARYQTITHSSRRHEEHESFCTTDSRDFVTS